MGRIYRRNDSGPWWGDWTDSTGKRFQRSLRTRDKKVATARLREHELAETTNARFRKQRLSEAIGYMITMLVNRAEGTREMYREKGRRIFTTLGDPFVHEITKDMLVGYISKRSDPDDPIHGQASPHTIHKELITIRRALREAVDNGVLRSMPPLPRYSAEYGTICSPHDLSGLFFDRLRGPDNDNELDLEVERVKAKRARATKAPKNENAKIEPGVRTFEWRGKQRRWAP